MNENKLNFVDIYLNRLDILLKKLKFDLLSVKV